MTELPCKVQWNSFHLVKGALKENFEQEYKVEDI